MKDFGGIAGRTTLIRVANNRTIDTISSKGGFQSCEKYRAEVIDQRKKKFKND